VSEEDSEPFDLDALASYQLRDHLLAQRLKGHDVDELERLLNATGALPEGPFGEAVLDDTATRVEQFREHLEPMLESGREPVEVDLNLDGFNLSGWLTGVGPQGVFTYRAAKIRPADRLRLWLNHLALNAAAPAGVECRSRHLGEGEKNRPPELVELAPLPAEQAKTLLADLLALYWEGLQNPVAFFPKSAFAYAERLHGEKGEYAAMSAAKRAWEGNDYSGIPGERDEPSIAVVFRDREPLEEGPFERLAMRVFEPMLACGEGK
jgi:exodeoxyribonuclease V gamma subunit